MLQPYPIADTEAVDSDAEADIDWLKQLIIAIRTVRSEANLAPGLVLNVLLRNASASDRERIHCNAAVLKKLAKTGSFTVLADDDETPPSLSALCGHMEILVPMAGLIDVEAEWTRLSKEREKHAVDIQRLDGKLNNAQFVARAPANVVAKEREKRHAAQDALTKIAMQLEKIQALR